MAATWKILAKNKKLNCFNREDETKWSEPYFFIQGADIQFGLISRYIDKNPVVDWEKEKTLAEHIVNQINSMDPKPRFFVICGDLCDAQPGIEDDIRAKQELDFKNIFGKINQEIPVICVCGNHDVGDQPTIDTVAKYHTSFGDDFFSFWCGGVFYMVINSQYLYDDSQVKEFAMEQEQWIEQCLLEIQKLDQRRVVVFQHIPWFLNSIDEDDTPYFTLKRNIRAKWLNKFKDSGVEAIFCGHYHRNSYGVYKGMPVVTTSAIGGQLGNDESGYDKGSDTPVEELENLKQLLERTVSSAKDLIVSKVQSSVLEEVNGHKTGHKEIQKTVQQDGNVVAKISQQVNVTQGSNGGEPKTKTQTKLEIPSKGIHKTIVKENQGGLDYSNNNNNNNNNNNKNNNNNVNLLVEDKQEDSANSVMSKLNSYAGGVEYSPLDMAEYVFWTGDEKGVTLAIEEFLEEGLMSKDEAINFLQSIKSNLDYMQTHYQGLHRIEDKIATKLQGRTNPVQKLVSPAKLSRAMVANVDYDVAPGDTSSVGLLDDEPGASLYDLAKPKLHSNIQGVFNDKTKRLPPATDEDYEELLERLRVADFLYTEYSLEEVIYQLAKVMFSQSLTRGSKEAQLALHRFTGFLEREASNGRISRTLEKKILDVLIAALSDTLAEHPELLSTAREGLANLVRDGSSNTIALKQLLHSAAQPVFTDTASKGRSSGVKSRPPQAQHLILGDKM